MAVYVGLEIITEISPETSAEASGKKTAGRLRAAVLQKKWNRLELLETADADFSGLDNLPEALEGIASIFASYRAVWTVGIGHGEFSFRHLDFPFKNARAIKAALPAAMEAEIPWSAEDIETSHLLISSSGDGAKVLACAVPNERIDFYRNALKEAGINARVVTPSSAALLSFYKNVLDPSAKGGGTEAVIDVNRNRMQLCLIREDGFTDFFSEEAEPSALERFVAANDAKPERTFTGGPHAGRLTEYGDDLSQDLSQDLSWKDGLKETLATEKNAHEHIVPIGLAARGFSGEGLDFSRTQPSSKALRPLRFAAAGALACLFLWTGSLAYGNAVKGNILKKTKSEIKRAFDSALPGVRMVKPALQLKQEVEKLDQRLRSTGVGGEGRVDFLWVLTRISKNLPDAIEVEIDEIIFSPESVTLNGKTGSFESVSGIREGLIGAKLFKKVEIADSRAGVESGKVLFKIRMRL